MVDLGDAGAANKHRDERFLTRSFTEGERRRIGLDSDPHRRLWSLWAAKETAYKVMVKSMPAIPAWPRHYEAHLGIFSSVSSIGEGVVVSPWGQVIVAVHAADSHIHCIGSSGSLYDLSNIVHGKRRLANGEAASQAARELILDDLSAALGISRKRIRIARYPGARGLAHPVLLIDGISSHVIDISISHDGSFTGYARSGIGTV